MKATFLLLATLLLPFFVFGQSEEQPDIAKTQRKLYIVDGIVIEQDSIIANMDVNDIESISILKDTPQIGDRYARHQIILITLKKPEHRIYVMADGFDSFLAAQPPKEFYSKKVLRSKNILMVDEWNRRYENPAQYGSTHSMRIDYDTKQDYGLDIEYQLYMFFKFSGLIRKRDGKK